MSAWTILWWGLLAASGVALWRGTQSPTARAVAVGALILVALPSPLESFPENLGRSSPRGGREGLTVQSQVTECVACTGSLEEGRWSLKAERVSGRYLLHPAQPEPYALVFRSGRALQGGKPLSPGCTAGLLRNDTPFVFVGAEGVDFQVGPGAHCP